jgi:hypothetical protein
MTKLYVFSVVYNGGGSLRFEVTANTPALAWLQIATNGGMVDVKTIDLINSYPWEV